MALAIFLSYGLQFYVPINIIGPWFRGLFTGDYAQQISDAGLRIVLIIFTCKSYSFISFLTFRFMKFFYFQLFWPHWYRI